MRQLRREERDAADTDNHQACDNLGNVRIERQQEANAKEETGDSCRESPASIA